MSAVDLMQENVWLERTKYEHAESAYYQRITTAPLTPLAEEVAKVRQRLIEISDTFEDPQCDVSSSGNNQFCDQKIKEFTNLFSTIQLTLKKIDDRLSAIEEQLSDTVRTCSKNVAPIAKPAAAKEEDDDVDLFGSDSDEENDEATAKIREARLADYNQKKSTKTAIIAKSSVVLDIKPWEDTTDMKLMEELVRKITMDGLLWGASKLVPLAYGIKKLQISSVVVDDKVSIDELQEKIEAIEDLVQSVDIAAFNKI